MRAKKILILLSVILASFWISSCAGLSEDVLGSGDNSENGSGTNSGNNGNDFDDDIDGDGVSNDKDDDIDGDGKTNDKDDDIDGDGVSNEDDGDIDGDGDANKDDDDVDGDGKENDKDEDIDGDGKENDDDDDETGKDTDVGTDDDSDKDDDSDDDSDNNDKDDDYLIVRVDDSVFYDVKLNNNGKEKITKTEVLEIEEIRESLDDAGIAPDDCNIVGIKILVKDKSTNFIEKNKDKRFQLQFFVDGELAISTPGTSDAFEVLTFGIFKDELSLNKGLYIENPAFGEFLNIVQDNSKKSVSIDMVITPIDEFVTTDGEELEVIFIAQAATKKKI